MLIKQNKGSCILVPKYRMPNITNIIGVCGENRCIDEEPPRVFNIIGKKDEGGDGNGLVTIAGAAGGAIVVLVRRVTPSPWCRANYCAPAGVASESGFNHG